MRTPRFALSALSLLALSTATITGCDGCAEPPATDDGGPNPLDPNGEGPGGTDGGPGPVQSKSTLTFVGTSPIELFYGASQQLQFRLQDGNGANVSGATVQFSVSGTAGQLNVLEALTNNAGIAAVNFTAGNTTGNVTVTATSAGIDDPASVVLQVKVNPFGNLQITVGSQTRIPVTRADVVVYRGAANTVPTCSALAAADTLPTATFNAEYTMFPSTRTFSQQAQGTVVTALAKGYSSDGLLIADACAEGTPIVGGQTAVMALVLQQLPTKLEGDYDVRMELDIGNALPEPYETYVNTVSNLLADPAGFAVYQAMRRYDPQWWYELVDYPNGTVEREYTYEEVSQGIPRAWTSFNTIQPALDSILAARLGQRYVDITTVGGDLKQALTAFEVGSRFNVVPTENTEDGYTITEHWNDVVFNWHYNCPVGDEGCARRLVELEGVDSQTYAPVATSPYGSIASVQGTPEETERFAIATEPHLFALRYGAVVMIAMNEVIFPSLSNGEANNLNEMLDYVIDCAAVGTSIADLFYPLIDDMTGEQFCSTGLTAVANLVEDRILLAQVGGGDPQLDPKEQQGALGGGTFYLVDQDHDLVTELVTDLEILVQWNDPMSATGPSDEIEVPIVGAGRRMATGCDNDSACEAGLFCQALPHYMKVQAVEMTCARPVGDIQGESSCTADAQCTTGLCVGASQNTPGTCFSACVDDTQCGTGTCTAGGASLDLNGELAGLGAASLDSCL